MPNTLTRFDPFRDLAILQDRIQSLFDDRLAPWHGDFAQGLDAANWAPAVDIVETDNDIVLKADLPGVEPSDVDIQVHDGTLTLKGKRKMESTVERDYYRRVERIYGSFMRSFVLPQTVESDKVEAGYKNGVLEIRLPKRPEAKPKQIKVAVRS